MQNRTTIRWGIIGCGSVTEIKSGPGFYKAANSQLVAVMRRQGDLAADFARRHNVPRWYDDADALIHDPQVDAVYIATPPGSHLQLALKVCAANKPAYVEKPMARNFTECQKMIDAFNTARTQLFVGFYRRGLPRFLKVRELLASGALGKITGITYRYSARPAPDLNSSSLPWRFIAEHSGGGLFLDVGSHTLDILDFLFGPLKDIAGSADHRNSPYDVEDLVSMHFRTADGIPGTATWDFASTLSQDLIEITGTEGSLSLSTFGNEPLQMIRGNAKTSFDLPNPPHVHQPLIQTIVDELLGHGACASTGTSAARTSKVMDQVLNQYYAGRADDFWTRPDTWPAH